jgi:hypothetical protein
MLTFIKWVMNLIRHLTFIKEIWYIHGRSLHTLHVSETLSGNGTRKLSSLFTNLPREIKPYLSLSLLLSL